MARDDNPSRDPESKRNGSGAPGRAGLNGNSANGDGAQRDRANAWSPRRGRSGYGMESIRPHLRAQLEQQRLMRPSFPEDYGPESA